MSVDIWLMRQAVMDAGDWSAKDVQDLSFDDLVAFYQLVIQESGEGSMCDCNVGLGKFEGEPCITFLAWQSVLLGGSDMTTEWGGQAVDWFRRPFNFDADPETVESARAYGYCQECIEEALADPAYGLAVWEDSRGFVGSRTFDTQAEFDTALAVEEAHDAEENA